MTSEMGRISDRADESAIHKKKRKGFLSEIFEFGD